MHFFTSLAANYLTRGFWGDEAWTIGISRLSLRNIIQITSQDFHPPFYYFLVHFLGQTVGWGEVSIRLLSVFFFLLTGITAYVLCKQLWPKSKLGPFAASLLTLFSPILLTYAMEARSYSLLAFESALSAYLFWHAKDELKGRYRWRTLYFLLGGVMVYTHYYAWFILAAHAFYLLFVERRKILPLLPAALGILLVQLPWLPTLFHQVGSVKHDYWIGAINSRTHLEFFLRVTGGDIATRWQQPLALLFGLTILGDFLFRLFTRKSRASFNQAYYFVLFWLFIPILIPTFISLTLMPVFFYRYLIFSALPLALLTIQALSRLRPLPFLAILLLFVTPQLRIDSVLLHRHPRSMREATAELNQLKPPKLNDDPVYTVLPAFAEVMYYTAPFHPVIVTPEGLVQFSGKSLLDAYVRLGYTQIASPPTSAPYYFLTPDKQVEYHLPDQP